MSAYLKEPNLRAIVFYSGLKAHVYFESSHGIKNSLSMFFFYFEVVTAGVAGQKIYIDFIYGENEPSRLRKTRPYNN